MGLRGGGRYYLEMAVLHDPWTPTWRRSINERGRLGLLIRSLMLPLSRVRRLMWVDLSSSLVWRFLPASRLILTGGECEFRGILQGGALEWDGSWGEERSGRPTMTEGGVVCCTRALAFWWRCCCSCWERQVTVGRLIMIPIFGIVVKLRLIFSKVKGIRRRLPAHWQRSNSSSPSPMLSGEGKGSILPAQRYRGRGPLG